MKFLVLLPIYKKSMHILIQLRYDFSNVHVYVNTINVHMYADEDVSCNVNTLLAKNQMGQHNSNSKLKINLRNLDPKKFEISLR